MTISDKLLSILEIKDELKSAILEKGVDINNQTSFSEYPDKIRLISTIPVDTEAPIIESFTLNINVDNSVIFEGKTESGANIVLMNPNGETLPVTINENGSFSSYVSSPAMEGVYTLIVSDSSGNTTVETKNLKLPVVPVIDPIIELFNEEPEGAFYDFNDLSTLFQDSEGLIPVTAVGQTVGKVLDKSGNNNHLIQPTVSRQPKLIRDEETGSYGLAWDGVDDVMYASIPNIESTSVHMFFSQRFVSISSSRFQFYLSDESIPLPKNNNRSLWLTTAHDTFFSSIVLKHFRLPANLVQRSNIFSLRNVFSSKHIESELLVLYLNKERIQAPNPTYKGLAWYDPSPMFIGLGGDGVTYKAILIGRELTDSEISMTQDILNIDVGAW